MVSKAQGLKLWVARPLGGSGRWPDRSIHRLARGFVKARGGTAVKLDRADDAPKRDRVRTGCLPGAIPDGP
jgi:hypothetical protein